MTNKTDEVTLQGVVKLVEQNYLQAYALLKTVEIIKKALGLFEEDERNFSVTDISSNNEGLVYVLHDRVIDIRKFLFLAENDLMLIIDLIGNQSQEQQKDLQ